MNRTATVDAGAGADNVSLDEVGAATLGVSLGAGNDHLTMDTITAASTSVDGGDGNDTMALRALDDSTLNVTLGAGVDTVSAQNNTVSGKATFDGGQGDDTYTDLTGNSYGTFVHKNIEHGV